MKLGKVLAQQEFAHKRLDRIRFEYGRLAFMDLADKIPSIPRSTVEL